MATLTVAAAASRFGFRALGTSSPNDLFPLNPNWPIGRTAIDRKIRTGLQSGRVDVRSRGEDIPTVVLEGRATFAEGESLFRFVEDHALNGFTLLDASFIPARKRRMKFISGLQREESGFNLISWRVTARAERFA